MNNTIGDAEIMLAARWLASKEWPRDLDRQDRAAADNAATFFRDRNELEPVAEGESHFIGAMCGTAMHWGVIVAPGRATGYHLDRPFTVIDVERGQIPGTIVWTAEVQVRIAEAGRPGAGPMRPIPVPG